MIHSQHSSQARPQSRSRLIVDDLSAQLAPLDMYGLTGLGCAVVGGGYRACGRFEEGAARPRSRSADWAELIESGAAQRTKKAGDAALSFSLKGPEDNVVNSADLP
jgi:hypothetical protein